MVLLQNQCWTTKQTKQRKTVSIFQNKILQNKPGIENRNKPVLNESRPKNAANKRNNKGFTTIFIFHKVTSDPANNYRVKKGPLFCVSKSTLDVFFVHFDFLINPFIQKTPNQTKLFTVCLLRKSN
ncbi:hypothetical protein XENORESO_010492 [Xenotaenia resolanae]|uniref:Uncharacterized protein n=1 Tax=Xenotaenia resolanae TaxID=208358 RepID=A0ABV0WG73_9TELE